MMIKNALSVFAVVPIAAAVVGLVLTHHLFARQPLLLAIQVAAALLMIWARRTFGLRSFHAAASNTPGGLVTTGPYHYWRHPIYASIIYFIWAGQIGRPSALPLALAAVATIGLVSRMLFEESYLTQAYPEYIQYARQTKRLVPYVF